MATTSLTLQVLDEQVLLQLRQFHYLTLRQITRVLHRQNIINYVRERLKRLSEQGLVETQLLPRTTPSGKTPFVYNLSERGEKYLADMGLPPSGGSKGTRKHTFLQHTLEVNDVLIAATLLEQREPRFILQQMLHERVLRQHPVAIPGVKSGETRFVVPDGWLDILLAATGEHLPIVLEVDRGTIDVFPFRERIRDYCAFAEGPYQSYGVNALSAIAWVVTQGGERRMLQMLEWTEQELKHLKKEDYADLFLFAALTPGEIDPLQFFFGLQWLQPRDFTRTKTGKAYQVHALLSLS